MYRGLCYPTNYSLPKNCNFSAKKCLQKMNSAVVKPIIHSLLHSESNMSIIYTFCTIFQWCCVFSALYASAEGCLPIYTRASTRIIMVSETLYIFRHLLRLLASFPFGHSCHLGFVAGYSWRRRLEVLAQDAVY